MFSICTGGCHVSRRNGDLFSNMALATPKITGTVHDLIG